jgi:tRNA threonylcarbamoyladenosine biosynthesis protein TsaB
MASSAQPVCLALDTAGLACSVAVGSGGRVLACERIGAMHGQSEILLPLVDRVMAVARLTPAALDLIAATVGPGSFTGIRAGLAAARGISLATGAPLCGVSSFAAAAAAVSRREVGRDRFVLVALESRREDLYVQLFDPSCEPAGEPAAIAPAALAKMVGAMIGQRRLLIAGDAARRAGFALAERPGTVVLEGAAPDAADVLHVALTAERQRMRSSSVRPVYLRAPDVAVPRRR